MIPTTVDELVRSSASLLSAHGSPINRRAFDAAPLRTRTLPSSPAIVLVVHSSALIAAGLTATLERHANITVRTWDFSEGPWLAENSTDVDVVFADSDCLRLCRRLDCDNTVSAERRPRIVWVTRGSDANPELSVEYRRSCAQLPMDCDEADVISTLAAVTSRSAQHHSGSFRTTGGLAPGAKRRVLSHIDQHLGARVTIATLAGLAGLSVCHFARAFKQSVGMPPCRYLMKQRICVAAEIVARTDRTLADVALEVGFCDQSHFTRLFSRELGEAPSAYRRRHR